jgi:hypothetical protein
VADEHRLLLDFLPYVERTIRRTGVVIDEILYYADVLAHYVSTPGLGRRGAGKRKFIFRRDPRDISVIEATVFAAIERKRAIVDNALTQTQRTRRERARRASHATRPPHGPPAAGVTPVPPGEP